MNQSLLVLNREKAPLSKLGYEEIYILHLILNTKFPHSSQDDDYNGIVYDCECHVKKDGISSIRHIPFDLISKEVKKGIYEPKEEI